MLYLFCLGAISESGDEPVTLEIALSPVERAERDRAAVLPPETRKPAMTAGFPYTWRGSGEGGFQALAASALASSSTSRST